MAPGQQLQRSWFYPGASIRDLKSAVFWRDVACELLAVTMLMAMVAFVLVSNNKTVYPITTTHLGIFAVVAVFLLIDGYGPMSALMNPAAALSLFLAGKTSLARALIFIVVETAGAAAGSGIGWLLTPERARSQFKAFLPVEEHGMTLTQSVAMEAFFTFNLVFVALSVHDTVNRVPSVLPSLTIASCIGIGIITGGTHTGGLMNPIIPFGPALLAQNFHNHWLYWVGPFTGGPMAVAVYKLFILIKVKYGPKPVTTEHVALSSKETAVTREELISLLDKLIKQQNESSVGV